MIAVKLKGGLGNQMHQLAFGRAQAQRLGVKLGLETSSFQRDPLGRRYSLGLWRGVHEQKVPADRARRVVREQGLPFNPGLVHSLRDGDLVDGYWQTLRYYSHILDDLRETFQPAQPLTARGRETLAMIQEAGDQAVFLTIRRTDYLASSFHGVLGLDYYLPALELVAKAVDPIVFVMSDDPQWCLDELRLPYPVVVTGNWDRTTATHMGREDEELHLMAACKHAVCANSSYSFWGAVLGPDHKGGVVVAPRRWFLTDEEDPRDICPEHWLRV